LSEPYEHIQPVGFQPPVAGDKARPHRPWPRWQPWHIVIVLALAVLAMSLWFVVSARVVTLEFSPAIEDVTLSGGFAIALGERRLLRPGQYTVRAQAAGYAPLSQSITVAGDGDGVFRFALEKLPGRLQVVTQPAGAAVEIDGKPAGPMPASSAAILPPASRRSPLITPRAPSRPPTTAAKPNTLPSRSPTSCSMRCRPSSTASMPIPPCGWW